MSDIIKTLYSLGEWVFFLHNNEVLTGRISSNNVDLDNSRSISVTIDVKQKFNIKYDTYIRKEEQVFTTKEDLLKSL